MPPKKKATPVPPPGINRSLAHASGSVGMFRGSGGWLLAKILRSLKRQRESDFRKPSFS